MQITDRINIHSRIITAFALFVNLFQAKSDGRNRRFSSVRLIVALARVVFRLRIQGQLEKSFANLLGIFLQGGKRTIAIAGYEELYRHSDFDNRRNAKADDKSLGRGIKSPLGRNHAHHRLHRKGNNRGRRHVKQGVDRHGNRPRSASVHAVCVRIQHFDRDRNGRLHTGALPIGLPFDIEIADRCVADRRTRGHEGQGIGRLCGGEFGKRQGLIFNTALFDTCIEDFLRLDTHLFRDAVDRIARDRARAFIRLEIGIKGHNLPPVTNRSEKAVCPFFRLFASSLLTVFYALSLNFVHSPKAIKLPAFPNKKHPYRSFLQTPRRFRKEAFSYPPL